VTDGGVRLVLQQLVSSGLYWMMVLAVSFETPANTIAKRCSKDRTATDHICIGSLIEMIINEQQD
jgi:hypothetical protein